MKCGFRKAVLSEFGRWAIIDQASVPDGPEAIKFLHLHGIPGILRYRGRSTFSVWRGYPSKGANRMHVPRPQAVLGETGVLCHSAHLSCSSPSGFHEVSTSSLSTASPLRCTEETIGPSSISVEASVQLQSSTAPEAEQAIASFDQSSLPWRAGHRFSETLTQSGGNLAWR